MGKPMSSVPIKGKPQNILDTSFGYARIVLFSIGTTDAILLYSKYLNKGSVTHPSFIILN